MLLRLEPDAIAQLAGRLDRGSVLVSATNGKTTTSSMLSAILERAGVPVVHNRAGSNMHWGVATALLDAGRSTGELGWTICPFFSKYSVNFLRISAAVMLVNIRALFGALRLGSLYAVGEDVLTSLKRFVNALRSVCLVRQLFRGMPSFARLATAVGVASARRDVGVWSTTFSLGRRRGFP